MDEISDGALSTLLPAFPPPGTPPPPPPGAARARRRWRRPAVVASLALLSAVAVSNLSSGDGGPRFPARWDSRVDELVSYVEYERGLDFEHPVKINFLPEKEFVAEVTADESELTDEDKADLADFEALFRAVGLAKGDFDLFDANNQLQGDSTLAYYDPEAKEVTVRGTEMTVGVKVTLVHELTHALQDQHFDLGRSGTFATDAENNTYDAIVEGDAQRIESRYLGELSEDDYNAYFDELYPESADGSADDSAGSEVPAWMSAYNEAPYALGEPFTASVFAAKGQKGLDRLFSTPPTTEEHLLDPARYLATDKAKAVAFPALPKGARQIDRADFGALTWLIMLSERIPTKDAVAAVEGWGGDAYVAYALDGKVCTTARFVGDDAEETAEMRSALGAFARAMPQGSVKISTVKISRKGAAVELFACDPGDKAGAGGNGASYEALGQVVGRSQTLSYLLEDDTPVAQAACLADGIAAEFTAEELSAEQIDRFEERMQPIRETCDPGPAEGG